MSGFELREMHVPGSVDDADAADFVAGCEVINRVQAEVLGSPDFSLAPVERQPYATDPDWNQAYVVAVLGGAVVAVGLFEAQKVDAPEGWIELYVLSEHRRAGIGTAILDWLIAAARADGRTELNSHILVGDAASGDRVPATSGHGDLAAGDPGVAFALASGFTLEQVAQVNRLELPLDPRVFAERAERAATVYGDDYELLHWSGAMPEPYLEDIARLFTEMSLADPHAGLQVTEDVWDAARVRETDERERSSPRTKLTAVARHRGSGRLVAFTTLDVPREVDRAVNQWATMVSAGHRGKRLGLAVKLENIRQLTDDYPGHPSITTMNAEENGYMIGVNRSVGFVTVGRAATFRRTIG